MNKIKKMMLSIAVICICMCASVCAQTTNTNESAAMKADSYANMTFLQMYHSGGWVMHLILALSIFTMASVFYLSVVLRVKQVAPPDLFREIIDLIKRGMTDDLRRLCEYRQTPLSKIVLAATDYIRDVPQVEPQTLKDIIEAEGSRQSDNLQGQTQYLLDVAVVAPMVGLLGTVFGLLVAFNSIGTDIARAKPIVLAQGVSMALVTTAFGLIVGIPAMMFYSYFRRKASKMITYLESASSDIFTAFLSRRHK